MEALKKTKKDTNVNFCFTLEKLDQLFPMKLDHTAGKYGTPQFSFSKCV